MALDQNIGMVTAYAYAVSKGYTGTEEQFAQELASAGADLSQIQTQIDNFVNTIVPEKTAEVTAEGTRQIGLVAAEGTTQKNAVTAEGTTQKNAVTSEGTTQKNAVNSAGSTQVGNVNTAGAAQISAIQIKGEETIESIPPDYTTLSNDVDDLKNAFIEVTELIKSRNWFDSANAEATTIMGTPVLVSPLVAVEEGQIFYYSYHLYDPNGLIKTQFYTIRYYNSEKTLTGNAGYWVQGVTIPSGVAYVSFISAQPTAQYIMVEEGIQTLQWEAYFEPYRTAKDTVARTDLAELKSIVVTSAEELQFTDKIYGVVGHELNVYYENGIRYGTMDTIAKCDIGGSLANCERYRDRLIWKPATSGTTSETISMYKSDTKTATKAKNVNFVCAPANAGSGTVKVLVIGDSKVQYGQVTGYLQDIFNNDSMTLELLGTRWGNNCTDDDTTNRHEGRGAWGAYQYCNAQSSATYTNPFYDASYTNPTYGGHFNFSKYMADQSYSGVDYVFINLGTNDFGNSPSTYYTNIMAIISSIHAYDSNVVVIPALIEGVYANKLEWATRNEAFFAFRQRLMDSINEANVYLNPMYLSMDLHNDYPFTSVPLSYADEFVNDGKTRLYCADGIHQNPAGFYKNAVSMYAIIKCIEAGIA